jgi:hypothetical protein
MERDSGIAPGPTSTCDIEIRAINDDVDVLFEMTGNPVVIGDQDHWNTRFQVLDECADLGPAIHDKLRINADHTHPVGLHNFNCPTLFARIYDLDSASNQIVPSVRRPRSIVIH